ncbi:MAG: glycosyltransferase family 39 protein [Deltaproteobacteria bacterium]|nr:glycosyltransferase family 39 protein [Deltaproteobacteria bacterium]MBW2399241.1 glycosyltransferase family 39 protein [Deltaproteobacteria bacterium]MBW2665321.1 glycosyltransferase family 39 protein [Deltaproteobacteria bacterium]
MIRYSARGMSRSTGWLPVAGFCLLLALFAVRLGDTAVRNSFTLDEPNYIGIGLYLWESGDYDYAATLSLHPPLAYHIASLPLLAFDLDDLPRERGIVRRLFERAEPGWQALRIAGRIPFILLTCWGAAICFLWARAVAGNAAGLLATFLYTFSPTMLANGGLAHSDITVTVFFLQTLYALWLWLMKPTPLRLLFCGVSLGLAVISKLNALVLLPSLALIFLLIAFRLRPARPMLPATGPDLLGRRLLFLLGAGLGMLGAAIFVVWLGYGGSFRSAALEEGPWAGIQIPAYLLTLIFDETLNVSGRRVYLLGEFANEAWWYYFPVAFAVKVPVAISALLGLAIVAPGQRPWRLGWLLGIPLAVYFVIACIWLEIVLGIRYVLPIFPLLFVFIATQLVPLGAGWRRNCVGALCAWLAIASLWIHPHYLAYFNEVAGGPSRGHRYLLDSNVDWGQDLRTLGEYLAKRGNPPVWLAYFGIEKPEEYGLRSRRLKGCRPVSGLVAISTNVREGLYQPHGHMGIPKPGCYDWLKSHEPVAHVGYSIFVYEIPKNPFVQIDSEKQER